MNSHFGSIKLAKQLKHLFLSMMSFVLKNCESGVLEIFTETGGVVGSQLLSERYSERGTGAEPVNTFAQKNLFTSKENYLYNDLIIAGNFKWEIFFLYFIF